MNFRMCRSFCRTSAAHAYATPAMHVLACMGDTFGSLSPVGSSFQVLAAPNMRRLVRFVWALVLGGFSWPRPARTTKLEPTWPVCYISLWLRGSRVGSRALSTRPQCPSPISIKTPIPNRVGTALLTFHLASPLEVTSNSSSIRLCVDLTRTCTPWCKTLAEAMFHNSNSRATDPELPWTVEEPQTRWFRSFHLMLAWCLLRANFSNVDVCRLQRLLILLYSSKILSRWICTAVR